MNLEILTDRDISGLRSAMLAGQRLIDARRRIVARKRSQITERPRPVPDRSGKRTLFEETATKLCPRPAATHFAHLHNHIVDSLQLWIAAQQPYNREPTTSPDRR